MSLGNLVARVGLDNSGLVAGAGVARSELSSLASSHSKLSGEVTALAGKFKSGFSAMSSEASGLSTVMTGVAGVGLGLGAVLAAAAVAGIGKFESQTAEVRKLKAALGATSEEASGMRNVAVALGIDVDKLSTGTAKLSVNLVKTGGDLAGVHVETARNADGTANLVKTWDNLRAAYQSIEDPQQKNVFLMQALSKGGVELRGVLSATNAEYDKMKARGPIYTDADLKAGRDMAIAQREFKASIESVEISLSRALIPALTATTKALADGANWVDQTTKKHNALGVVLKSIGETAIATFTFGLSTQNTKTKESGQVAEAVAAQFQIEKAALADVGVELDSAEIAQGALTKEHQAAVVAAEKYAKQLDDMGSSVSSAYALMGGATEALSTSTRDEAKAFDQAKSAADSLKEGLDILVGVHITARQASINWEAAIADTSTALKENKATLDITTAAGRDNESTIIKMIQAGLAHVDALEREGASSETVSAAYGDHVAALRRVMEQAGYSKQQIDELINSYGLLAAQPNISKTVTTNVNTYHNDYYGEYQQGNGGRQTAYAEGGFIDGPTFALMGEAGRELVLPLTDMRRTFQLLSQAGFVKPFAAPMLPGNIPRADSSSVVSAGASSASSAGAPVVVHVYPSAGMDERALGASAAREMAWAARR